MSTIDSSINSVVYKHKATNTCRRMSLQTLFLRGGIVLGLVATVVTILYLTPIPDQYYLSCERPCHDLDWPMICRIKIEIEMYRTMSPECNSCYLNKTECHQNANCIIANGIRRQLLTANRQLPGPPIHVCQNDILVIDVINKIPGQSVTLHWRGQTQEETPFMDGVPMISQCPVTAYTTFQYKFRAGNPGTHLWQAYSGVNTNNGLFGALIVRQPDKIDPHRLLYDHDKNEHVFMISNWDNEFKINPSSVDSLLINGKSSQFDPLTIVVKPKKRYRFRIAYASGSNSCPIQVSIDGHRLKLITLDGQPITPRDVAAVILNRGERCDFILKTKSYSNHNFHMKVKTIDCQNVTVQTSAIVKYISGVSAADDKDVRDFESVINENKIVLSDNNENNVKLSLNKFCENISDGTKDLCVDSVHSLEKLPIVLREHHTKTKLIFAFDGKLTNDKFTNLMCVNNLTFTFPSSPIATQSSDINFNAVCSLTDTPQHCRDQKKFTASSDHYLCECLHIEKIPLGDTVEIILIDKGGDNLQHHIYHLHGYSFWIVGARQFASPVSYDEIKELDERGMLFTRNLLNPVKKDTISIPKYGAVAIRFKADNPGYWILREEHNSLSWTRGTDVILQVGEQTDFVQPPTDFPKCGNYIGPEFFLA